MASYKVYTISFKQSVAKDLRVIPKQDVRRILDRIDTLATNPRGEGCVKLSGQEHYRVRQGVYRIVYEIHDDRLLVIVVKIGHRSGVYEKR
ncbi:MAG: type II toxin-antitoxin system RelE/ParE family toxin [Burkholderiales bacterium]|nr:type II toxin-antitoxin system RelE/ParE family toxin [Burkholderiales bacterium]